VNWRPKGLADAINALPPNYKLIVSYYSNFKATLYCDPSANVLVLAFKGSVSLTPFDKNAIDDWIYNNTLQQFGDRTPQYMTAEDIAALIKKDWTHGEFDGVCGNGRPAFVLTGHSKGGGEAQYAGFKTGLRAFVFNAAPVNPAIFSDWVLMPDASLIARRIRAAAACVGWSSADARDYAAYISGGKLRDVRMVNDPLTNYLLPLCNFPHAPIEWLVNTLTCSGDGHAIETVVRELHACAP
jgi:hypothetical protein